LWRDYPDFLPWARTTALVVGIAAIVVLVAVLLFRQLGSRWLQGRRLVARVITIGLVAGVAAVLAAPATWAASVLDTKYGGSSLNAGAGPVDGGFGAFGGGGGARRTSAAARDAEALIDDLPAGLTQRAGGGGGGAGGFGGGLAGSSSTTLSSSERAIYDYVSAHRDGASYLMAVSSWSQAAPYIVATGQEVMPMGGFSGTVPEPSLAKVKELVSSGQLRFFMLTGTGTGTGTGAGGFGGGGFGGRGGGNATVQSVTSWVESSCTQVPAQDYGASTSTSTATGTGAAGAFGGGAEGGTLYHCTAA
jgi:4-amino-4-deoxy-L-arabinose transferase-like glycosyltransferase